MKDFQQRVIDERAELVTKLDKLTDFLKAELFAKLPDEEKERLTRQHRTMSDYAAVLAERIVHFR